MKSIIKNNLAKIIGLPLFLLIYSQSFAVDLKKDPLKSVEFIGPDLKNSHDGIGTIFNWICDILIVFLSLVVLGIIVLLIIKLVKKTNK